MTLKAIWEGPHRLETGFPSRTRRAELNPVADWLSSAPRGTHAHSAHQLQLRLAAFANTTTSLAGAVSTPSFVAGAIGEGGGPTHYDDYDNFAYMVVGVKTFYIAPYAALHSAPLHGEVNERLSVTPFECGPAEVSHWRRAVLQAGDVLYLPTRWWHYVVSHPHSVMTNTWAPQGRM